MFESSMFDAFELLAETSIFFTYKRSGTLIIIVIWLHFTISYYHHCVQLVASSVCFFFCSILAFSLFPGQKYYRKKIFPTEHFQVVNLTIDFLQLSSSFAYKFHSAVYVLNNIIQWWMTANSCHRVCLFIVGCDHLHLLLLLLHFRLRMWRRRRCLSLVYCI